MVAQEKQFIIIFMSQIESFPENEPTLTEQDIDISIRSRWERILDASLFTISCAGLAGATYMGLEEIPQAPRVGISIAMGLTPLSLYAKRVINRD